MSVISGRVSARQLSVGGRSRAACSDLRCASRTAGHAGPVFCLFLLLIQIQRNKEIRFAGASGKDLQRERQGGQQTSDPESSFRA
jgi:hypothetical protein